MLNSSQPSAFPQALFDKHLLLPPRPSPGGDQDPALPRSEITGLVGCRFRMGTPPLVVDALARFSGLSNGHELSILDGTTFSVVARATVDLAGELAISTGSIGVRHYKPLSPPVNLAAGTQYLLMSSGR